MLAAQFPSWIAVVGGARARPPSRRASGVERLLGCGEASGGGDEPPPREERAPGPVVPAPPRKQVRAAARQGPAFYKFFEIAAASCGSKASPPREERPAAAPRARSIKTLRNISFMRSR